MTSLGANQNPALLKSACDLLAGLAKAARLGAAQAVPMGERTVFGCVAEWGVAMNDGKPRTRMPAAYAAALVTLGPGVAAALADRLNQEDLAEFAAKLAGLRDMALHAGEPVPDGAVEWACAKLGELTACGAAAVMAQAGFGGHPRTKKQLLDRVRKLLTRSARPGERRLQCRVTLRSQPPRSTHPRWPTTARRPR